MSQTVRKTNHSVKEEFLKKLKCMTMFQYSVCHMYFGIMKAGLNSGISFSDRLFSLNSAKRQVFISTFSFR